MTDDPVKHVLLIEDDLQDALLVTRRLERERGTLEGIRLSRAATLGAGLELLAKEDVDVVLLDLELPDSASTETVRRLREAEPEVPIVVFTSSDDAEMPVQALQAGAQDFLGKSDFETGPVLHRSLRHAIERRLIEEEKHKLQHELEEAERLQSLGVLGAGAAFGFNQLIGTMLDHADEALDRLPAGPGAESARNHLHALRETALRAAEIAGQLREYAGADRSPTGPVDLSALVRDQAEQLEAIAGRNIRIDYALEQRLPPVEGNALELRQLLLNLVVNAIEAIGPRAGRIQIETLELTADAALLATGRGAPRPREGRYVALCLVDSGPGLDERALAHVFDPFFTTKFAGRGLGLAAALGIVRRHGGRILAGNEARSGARFEVLLPPIP